eukprot:1155688-Pelagomonas_calceolata.AAC.2
MRLLSHYYGKRALMLLSKPALMQCAIGEATFLLQHEAGRNRLVHCAKYAAIEPAGPRLEPCST